VLGQGIAEAMQHAANVKWAVASHHFSKRSCLPLSPPQLDQTAQDSCGMAAAGIQASSGSGRRQGKKKNLNLSLNTDTAKVRQIHQQLRAESLKSCAAVCHQRERNPIIFAG